MKTQLPGEELLTAEDYEAAGQMVAEPQPERKPNNFGLGCSLIAANFAFLVVDAISAIVVGYLTRWYYGAATLFAGAIFMFVHEFLFVRAFNNVYQRRIAIGGAVWAIATIVVIALMSVVANLTGFMTPDFEVYFLAFMVCAIVFNIVLHGVLCGLYYYLDDGHLAKSKAARASARALTQVDIDNSAGLILTMALKRRINYHNLLRRFRSPSALRAALREAGDADHDGIPDTIDPVDNRTGKPFQQVRQYSSQTDRPDPSAPTRNQNQ